MALLLCHTNIGQETQHDQSQCDVPEQRRRPVRSYVLPRQAYAAGEGPHGRLLPVLHGGQRPRRRDAGQLAPRTSACATFSATRWSSFKPASAPTRKRSWRTSPTTPTSRQSCRSAKSSLTTRSRALTHRDASTSGEASGKSLASAHLRRVPNPLTLLALDRERKSSWLKLPLRYRCQLFSFTAAS